MNIYLDIDGVILANDKRVANYSHEFIDHLVNKYPVYWLTTHCRGDASYTVNHLRMFFNSETMKLIERILPTNWDILKTMSAIHQSGPGCNEPHHCEPQHQPHSTTETGR